MISKIRATNGEAMPGTFSFLYVLLIATTTAKFRQEQCKNSGRISGACGERLIALALTGHTRAFMTDEIISTSLRENFVQALQRQNGTAYLVAHVKGLETLMKAYNAHAP